MREVFQHEGVKTPDTLTGLREGKEGRSSLHSFDVSCGHHFHSSSRLVMTREGRRVERSVMLSLRNGSHLSTHICSCDPSRAEHANFACLTDDNPAEIYCPPCTLLAFPAARQVYQR